MGERESRVVYRVRPLDRDQERPRIPTALNPYNYSYTSDRPRDRHYDVRDSSTSIDDRGSVTESIRSTSRTTRAPRDDDRTMDVYLEERKSNRSKSVRENDISMRSQVVVDERRNELPLERPYAASSPRISRQRGYLDVELDRSRKTGREYIVDDRPRRIGAPYVINTREGDVLDITVPSGHRDRAYNRNQQRGSTETVMSPRTSARDRDYHYDRRPARTTTRYNDEEEFDDEWRLIDSTRETRASSAIDTRFERGNAQQGRSRARTDASEDSYVLVSPTSTPKHRESSTSRSALARRDYPEPELHRRRSRSISFRDTETDRHDAGERRHERPGAEAIVVGQYLGRPLSDFGDDDSVVIYRSSTKTARDERLTARSEADNTYASSNVPSRRNRYDESDRHSTTYNRQDDHARRHRDRDDYGQRSESSGYDAGRSRHSDNKRRDEDNDESYYSERVTRTVRESRN